MAELWNHESQICQACDVSSPGVVAWPLVCLCPCNLATGREQLLSSQTKRQKTAWERNARLHGRRQQVSMLASYFASHGGQCQCPGIKANLCFSQVILISRRCGPVWTIPFQTKQVYISSRRSRVLLPWFTTLSPLTLILWTGTDWEICREAGSWRELTEPTHLLIFSLILSVHIKTCQ